MGIKEASRGTLLVYRGVFNFSINPFPPSMTNLALLKIVMSWLCKNIGRGTVYEMGLKKASRGILLVYRRDFKRNSLVNGDERS